jgi:serine/threonine-protein kinase HipA
MIRIWTDQREAGVLDRFGARGSTFAYAPEAPPQRAVSLTMPTRVRSWDWPRGLLPIFEMNLPEGTLRERIIRRFAKAAGAFDDLDLLAVVGRTQLGRIRYSGMGEGLDEEVPFQSVDEIIRARRDGGLYDYLLERFAQYSGLSGVQPKVLVRDQGKLSAGKARRSSSIRAATHIVKMWDKDEYAELAANEHYCLMAARAAGLEVPPFALADNGEALIVERFDLRDHDGPGSDGDGYLGLEDFCVLNGLGTADKYSASYESRLWKRLADFIGGEDLAADLGALYRLFVLNCALRNGDAHLKNFALIYEAVDGRPRLAPVFDLVTTTAYLPNDRMALTLEGSTRWPDRARLLRLGQLRAGLGGEEVAHVFEATADAMSAAWVEARAYFAQCPRPDVGERMRLAWEQGIAQSLGQTRGLPDRMKREPALRDAEERPPGMEEAPQTPYDAVPLSSGQELASRWSHPLASRRATAPPASPAQAAILTHLRAAGGAHVGAVKTLAAALDLPASTVSGALRVLAERGLIARDGRAIALRDGRGDAGGGRGL